MKQILLSLTIFSLALVEISCASLTKDIVKEVLLPPLETGAIVSMINYDSIYYSMDYYLSKKTWPISKEELSDYAKSKNHTIDFEQYKYYSIEQCSPKRINIHFIIKKIEGRELSLNDVKGIVGIYIEDEKKVNIYNYEDEKIIISFTVGKYPYDTKNIEVNDGYSVHEYIEYSDARVKIVNGNNTNIMNQPMFKIQEMNIR